MENRFYNGLSQGIEVPLFEGRVAIGSDPLLADLVVVDPGIAAVHVVLDVSAQGIRLLEWNEGCSPTESGLALTETAALQPLAAQRCGSLLWAYCGEGQAFDEQLKLTGPVRPVPLAGHGLKWTGWLTAGGSVLVLVIIIGLLSESWFVSSKGQALDSRISSLRTFLKGQHLLHVEVGDTGVDGKVPIRGYVENNRERLTLQHYLEHSSLAVHWEVFSLEDIRQDADFILNKLGFEGWTSSNAERPGWLRISGASALDEADRQHVEHVLKADLPGFLGVEVAEPARQTPREKLEQLLRDHSLAAALAYSQEGAHIELSGELDAHQYARFVELNREFKVAFGDNPELRLINKTATARGKKTNLVIRYVSLGAVPYIVLENSQKYPVGALIPGVGRLLEITKETICIGVGTQRLTIDTVAGGRG